MPKRVVPNNAPLRTPHTLLVLQAAHQHAMFVRQHAAHRAVELGELTFTVWEPWAASGTTLRHVIGL